METVVFISVIAVVILFMVASLIVCSNYSIRVFGFCAGAHLLGSSFWITLSLKEFYHVFVIFFRWGLFGGYVLRIISNEKR